MSIDDKKFYELQTKNPPIGYCATFVDKKWKKMKTRKESRENRSRKEHYEFVCDDSIDNDSKDGSSHESNSMYTDDTEETSAEKKNYKYRKEPDPIDDELPFKYRHIRQLFRGVRPEVYKVIAKMKSKYHMSQAQAE